MARVVQFRQCDKRNYTKGRQGHDIGKVVVHYTGGKGSAYENLLYFSREAARASAHYFIGKQGDIRQSVRECDTAWHAGNWKVNLESVGIEVCSNGEDFTEAQITSLSELVGELMARYKLGPADVIRHYDVTGKLCPAPYVDAAKWKRLRKRIASGAKTGSGGAKAKKGSGAKAKAKKAAGTSSSAEDKRIEKLARAVIDGDYGNGAERKKRLGKDYAAVQKRVNEILR